MTTDEMILALVERHGFKLPDGYIITCGGGFKDTWSDEWVNQHDLNRKRLHDLCSMEFARQVMSRHMLSNVNHTNFIERMVAGDSAAAIKALYEAMEAK